MPISYPTCPLCGSDKLESHLKAEDHLLTHEIFSLDKCRECGFILTQGVPSADNIGSYYQSQDYVSHSDTRQGLMNQLYHFGRSVMLARKYRMVSKASSGKKLLDIGTGTGYFPGFMKKKGFKVTGIEIDTKAREFARAEFGIEVFSPGDFLEGRLEGKFDVITLWHVLEHLNDFDRYIEKMMDHLEENGVMVIALPNCDAYDARSYGEKWAGYDVPRHLWHFTPSTVIKLAEKHRLKLAKMKRLPLDPLYNSMLSEKYRKNKLFMISGTVKGMLAYFESLFNIEKSSSVVYILKRMEA